MKCFFYLKNISTNFISINHGRSKRKDRIPEIYFKHLENTEGLYEIWVQVGNNISRIFSFFDENNLVVVGHGFQKKTQKTPTSEIEKATIIKKRIP